MGRGWRCCPSWYWQLRYQCYSLIVQLFHIHACLVDQDSILLPSERFLKFCTLIACIHIAFNFPVDSCPVGLQFKISIEDLGHIISKISYKLCLCKYRIHLLGGKVSKEIDIEPILWGESTSTTNCWTGSLRCADEWHLGALDVVCLYDMLLKRLHVNVARVASGSIDIFICCTITADIVRWTAEFISYDVYICAHDGASRWNDSLLRVVWLKHSNGAASVRRLVSGGRFYRCIQLQDVEHGEPGS